MKSLTIASLTAALIVAAVAIGAGSSSNGEGTVNAGNVTEARVIAEASRGANWMINGGLFGAPHFSPLKQINDQNVGKLGLAWSLDIDSPMGMSSEPIVVDGTIYLAASLDRVFAIDAASGRLLWKYYPDVRLSVMRNSATARTNRGVAVWEGKVYVGTGDCRLIALEAATGRKLWDSPVCADSKQTLDSKQTGITGAPRVGGGKVYIGYNGSDTGVRGSVVAFDANTGKLAWRFWNVPGDPAKGFENKALEMAAKTWSGTRWWEVGGADVWNPITYDNVTGLLIYGTAGATPDMFFGDREDWAHMNVGGDRLFAGCIVAVKADTGEYAWHYQTSIHTENFHVLITNLTIGGVKRHVVMTVPRSGVFYVLDARSGKLISQKDLASAQTPAASDASPATGARATAGHNWWPMSYNPITGLVYIPAYDGPRRSPTGPPVRPSGEIHGRLIAWDPIRQSARWSVTERFEANSGVLSTAGNLVFEGEGTGEFEAFAADSGRKLWSVRTDSAIDAVPVSFSVGKEQYILVPVGLGSHSRNFGPVSVMASPESKRGPSRLLAFRLGATMPFPDPHVVVPPVPKPPDETASTDEIHRGAAVYIKFQCNDCHSPEADGQGAWMTNGAIPDLRYMPSEVHDQFLGIVMGGSHRSNGMPGFADEGFARGDDWPIVKAPMTIEEANAVHAYIIDQSWKAYKDDQARLNAAKSSAN